MFLGSCTVAIVLLLSAVARADSPRCAAWAAQLVSLEGAVFWRSQTDDSWHAAELHDYFCHGDTLRVEEQRAALRLDNNTLVRLNRDSVIHLQSAETSFWLQLIKGAGHFLSRTPKPFTVKAPYLNAAVDGTEFIVSEQTGRNRVAVVEGAVLVSNPEGQLRLTQGQQAEAGADSAPRGVFTVQLHEAAEWTLYFPPLVVHTLHAGELQPLLERGQYRQAYRRLQDTGGSTALTAALALALGRRDEAREWLTGVEDGDRMEVKAIGALMTLLQGQAQAALQQTSSLVESAGNNVTALTVHAYALQGNRQLDKALQLALQALDVQPRNVFLQARVAELYLSQGKVSHAAEHLDIALSQAPEQSQLHALSGFVALNRMDSARALRQFNRAITLASGEPLSHWGRGMALMQLGRTEAGRQALELAVLLDPNNSALRSYLGRAYAQQHQTAWAGTQYALAQQLDPADPTPWLYNAGLLQEQNRVPEAYRLLQQAIVKNDNRAVYRSRSLLGSDAAAHQANQARLFQQLGFMERARALAARAVSDAPTDYAAHHALALSYASQPRAQMLRADAALQSKLLQPVTANALNVGIGQTGIQAYPWLLPSHMGLHEYGPAFNRRGISGYATPTLGSQASRGHEWQLQATGKSTALIAGQYQQQSAGYRTNNDLDVALTELALHQQLPFDLKLLVEYNRRQEIYGDLTRGIESPYFHESLRRDNAHRARSLGLAWQPKPHQALLAHVSQKRGVNLQLEPVAEIEGDSKHQVHELTFVHKGDKFSLQTGYAYERLDAEGSVIIRLPFPPFNINDDYTDSSYVQRLYLDGSQTAFGGQLRLLAGIGGTDSKWGQQAVEHHQQQPTYKLGLSASLPANLRVTLARWRALAELYPRTGRLEPTHIFDVGIRQDLANLSPDDSTAVRAAWESSGFHAALQLRDSKYKDLGLLTRGSESPEIQAHPIEQREWLLDLSYLLNDRVTLFSDWRWVQENKMIGLVAADTQVPLELDLRHVNLGLAYFHDEYWSGRFSLDWVEQTENYFLNRDPGGSLNLHKQRDQAPLVNAALNFRFPKRSGFFSLEAYNLLHQPLSIYAGHLQSGAEAFLPAAPVFAPGRTLISKLTFTF